MLFMVASEIERRYNAGRKLFLAEKQVLNWLGGSINSKFSIVFVEDAAQIGEGHPFDGTDAICQ